jgi:hypothetical protein
VLAMPDISSGELPVSLSGPTGREAGQQAGRSTTKRSGTYVGSRRSARWVDRESTKKPTGREAGKQAGGSTTKHTGRKAGQQAGAGGSTTKRTGSE